MNEKRRTIVNKLQQALLKSSRVSERFEESWAVHCRMFGDILEPAFAEDAAARLELCAALNMVSKGRIAAGMRKLEQLYESCIGGEDLAAWHFFMGICCEKSGLSDIALFHYGESAKHEPSFYMVYLLLAKGLHSGKHFEAAAGTYYKTLEMIHSRPKRDEIPAVRTAPLIGSVHGNLANCLIMMRRYDEAEYELYEAERYEFTPARLLLTWATLYAATGRRALAKAKMNELKAAAPDIESASILYVMEIAEQKNPRFSPRSIDTGKIARFWQWFSDNERRLRALAFGVGSPAVMRDACGAVSELFDFGMEKPGFDFGRDGEKARLSFFDNYNLSFELWLERLVETAPKTLREGWSFYSVH